MAAPWSRERAYCLSVVLSALNGAVALQALWFAAHFLSDEFAFARSNCCRLSLVAETKKGKWRTGNRLP